MIAYHNKQHDHPFIARFMFNKLTIGMRINWRDRVRERDQNEDWKAAVLKPTLSLCFAVINTNVTPFSIRNDNEAHNKKKTTYCIIPITKGNSFKIRNERKWNENVSDSIYENEICTTKATDIIQQRKKSEKEELKKNDKNRWRQWCR